MDNHIREAMKKIGIYKNKNSFHNLQMLKQSVLKKNSSQLKKLIEQYLILMKNLPASLLDDSFRGSDKLDLFRNSVKSVTYHKEKEMISLTIKTNFHLSVKNYLDKINEEIFSGLGQRKSDVDSDQIKLDEIVIVHGQTPRQFPGCVINVRASGPDTGTEYKLDISGDGSILVLVHYFETMICLIFREVILCNKHAQSV